MSLHHTSHIDNIRSAYQFARSQSEFDSVRSAQTSRSGCSQKSSRTQAIGYSSSLSMPRMQRCVCNSDGSASADTRYFQDRDPQESPRSSSETYASTLPTEEDEDSPDDEYEYPVSPIVSPSCEAPAIAATPREFSELFPSSRKLAVRHDDSTPDGNMNLRIDTEVLLEGGERGKMTLFHLRMHDLRNRKFSLRRYCRDSGREVCHSERKCPKLPALKRPGFQRSLSNAFSGIRPKADHKNAGSLSGLKRHDSGYGSMDSVEIDNEGNLAPVDLTPKPLQLRRNVIQLEFSNYAQVAVKRTGFKSHRRYEFEYWGTNYAWRRSTRKVDDRKEVSYHLHAAGTDKILAHIVPTALSSSQTAEQQSRGGWIPPCTIWIADKGIIGAQKDIADVIVASGLIALVDNAIKWHFHAQDSKQLLIPVPKFHIGVEYVGPKQIIHEMFHRRGSNSAQNSRRPSLAARRRPLSMGDWESRMPTNTPRQMSNEC